MSGPRLEAAAESDTIAVLIPTHNDWEALQRLLDRLSAEFAAMRVPAEILIVDDGSTATMPRLATEWSDQVRRVEVLRLRRNLGHQRAIAVGLCFLATARRHRGVVVMDGDGEDSPADIARLLAACGEAESEVIAFAGRLRRSEGVTFAVFYHGYRLLHRIVTGLPVRMGNFSVLPWRYLSPLVVSGELWSHYAAAVVQLRLPYVLVPCKRERRVAGRTKMNFVALVAHGLSAMTVFADRIGVRALVGSSILAAALLAGVVAVLVVKFFTERAIPGWATLAAGILLLLLSQLFLLSILFTFVILAGRSQATIIPLREHEYFVEGVSQFWPSGLATRSSAAAGARSDRRS